MGKKLRTMIGVICFLFAGMIPFGVTAKADDTVTITFDYGINQGLMEKNNYIYDGKTFTHSVKVDAGEAVSLSEIMAEEDVLLPSQNATINQMIFDHWQDQDGSVWSFGSPDKDITLTAKWTHRITYNAGVEGHFYNGDSQYEVLYDEDETIIDFSVCVYTNNNSRAFIGWSLVPDGTESDVLNDMAGELAYYKNLTLYAVYTDGYSLTFDVNQDGGYIQRYCESSQAGGWSTYGVDRSFSGKSLTLTYPLGVSPQDAPYFCLEPINYSSYLVSGDDSVIFSHWSSDQAGKHSAYFDNLTLKQDGRDRLYAVWKGYLSVTYDPNTEYGGYATQGRTEEVVSGNSVHYVPTFEGSGLRSFSFNTKKDGSGDVVSYGYKPTSDITVYAQYKPVYYIYLNGNEGAIYQGYSPYRIIDKGSVFSDDLSRILVRWPDVESGKVSRKVVAEWNTAADGTGVSPSATFVPKADTTFYAIPKDGVLITFDTNANDEDPNDPGTTFDFRWSGNVTEYTFAYSKDDPMKDVPRPKFINNTESKEFAGWSTVKGDKSKIIDPNTFIPTKDMTLYATWYDKVEITYAANGGSFYGDDSYSGWERVNEKFSPYQIDQESLPSGPAGKVFAGWSETADGSKPVPYGKTYVPTKPMILYALWENGYNITLYGNGGTLSREGSGYSYLERDSVSLNIKKGSSVFDSVMENMYIGQYGMVHVEGSDNKLLAGWSKTPDGELVDLTSYVPQGNEEFYAIWADPCVVTFDANGGVFGSTSKTTRDVLKGNCLTELPVLESNDSSYLVGWFTEDNKRFNESTPVTGNMKVTARWTTDTVNVTLDAGSRGYYEIPGDTMDTTTTDTKKTFKMAKGAEIRFRTIENSWEVDVNWPYANTDADIFDGWKKSDSLIWSEGSAALYVTIDEDVTFSAVWRTPAYYTVSFDGNGGLVDSADIEGQPGDTATVKVEKRGSLDKIVTAIRKTDDGKVFTGWFADANCTTLVALPEKIATYTPSSDIKLYAGWKENQAAKIVKVTGVGLDRESVILGYTSSACDTYQLKPVIYPVNATNRAVTYKSSDESVATVNEEGIIVPQKAGTDAAPAKTVITVKTVDGGYTAACEVSVVGTTSKKISNLLSTAALDLVTAGSKQQASLIVEELGVGSSGWNDGTLLVSYLQGNDTVATQYEKLDVQYGKAANIIVEEPAANSASKAIVEKAFGVDVTTENLAVCGAALNAEPDQIVSLAVEEPTVSPKIDDALYDIATQVDISLKVDREPVKNLAYPVTVTMPIPQQTLRSNLYVLHFNDDGTFELIKPVFKHNSMKITVSHFSVFAIVELAEGEEIEAGNNGGSNGGNSGGNTGGKNTDKVTPAPSTGDQGSEQPTTASKYAPVDTRITAKTGTYVVTGEGTAAFKAPKNKKITSLKIASKVDYNGQSYQVISIANKALKGCKKLKSVTIPKSVIAIGSGAFEGCVKLSKVTIKSPQITSIGKNAFKNIKKKATIKVPKKKKSAYKSLLKKAKLAKSVTVK